MLRWILLYLQNVKCLSICVCKKCKGRPKLSLIPLPDSSACPSNGSAPTTCVYMLLLLSVYIYIVHFIALCSVLSVYIYSVFYCIVIQLLHAQHHYVHNSAYKPPIVLDFTHSSKVTFWLDNMVVKAEEPIRYIFIFVFVSLWYWIWPRQCGD